MKLLLHEGSVAEKAGESFPLKRRSVCFRIHREYHKFQYHILRMNKEEIMDKCIKIHFYGCVKEYFRDNDSISEDVFAFLFRQKDIIHSLWELYLKYEQFGCSTWEQIDEMMEYWMES